MTTSRVLNLRPSDSVEPGPELMNSDLYFVWSNEHRAWWKHGGWGYSRGIVHAGKFTREHALAICRNAIPTAAHLGAVAEVPVRVADMAAFLQGQMVPACVMVGEGG